MHGLVQRQRPQGTAAQLHRRDDLVLVLGDKQPLVRVDADGGQRLLGVGDAARVRDAVAHAGVRCPQKQQVGCVLGNRVADPDSLTWHRISCLWASDKAGR